MRASADTLVGVIFVVELMTEYYDPDPLSLGVMAWLRCISCGRDRYNEVVSTKAEDVIIVGEGPVLELPSRSCECGETKIRTDWSNGDGTATGLDDYGLDDCIATGTGHGPSQTAAGYWDTPTAPLPAPLPHQFRYRESGLAWEADFQRMILSATRTDELLLSEEPVLFDLQRGAAGELCMRQTADSRRTMAANIEARLARRSLLRDALSDQQDRAKLAQLAEDVWLSIPPGVAEAVSQRYTAYLGGRSNLVKVDCKTSVL